MPSALDVLTPSRVRGIVSRIKTPGSVMARHFGFDIDGKNTTDAPPGARTYTYDIFDNTRTVARGRLPGAPANAIVKNPVSNNTVTLARNAEKITLDYSMLDNLRAIGENAGQLDKRGAKYVDAQARYVRQRADNWREFVTGSLFRGGVYYFVKDGEDLVPSYTSSGSFFGVDLQVPSSNKLIGGSFAAGLQMGTGANIIDASWATASTDIPTHLMKISRAFQTLVGAPLKTVYVDHLTWLYVLQNTLVRQLAGTSNNPYAAYDMENDKAPDGTLTGKFTGRIHGLTWLDWVIYDGSIQTEVANTDTQILPDSYATFTIDKDAGQWLMGVEGSETVKDNDLAPGVMRSGLYNWVMEYANPARFELHSLQNFGLELNTPKGIATARVR
jgi:hypothetical protein